MHGPGEHIAGADGLYAVAAVSEDAQVSCESRGIAADIYDAVRRHLEHGIETLKGTSFDITLKDVETLEGDENRAKEWVQLARETIEKYG